MFWDIDAGGAELLTWYLLAEFLELSLPSLLRHRQEPHPRRRHNALIIGGKLSGGLSAISTTRAILMSQEYGNFQLPATRPTLANSFVKLAFASGSSQVGAVSVRALRPRIMASKKRLTRDRCLKC